MCSLQVSLASALSDLGEFEEERLNIQQIRPLRHKVEQLSQHAERLVTALSARDAQVRLAWALHLMWREGEEVLVPRRDMSGGVVLRGAYLVVVHGDACYELVLCIWH